MDELAAELGVGKSLPLGQHLPEEQPFIRADKVDTITGTPTGIVSLTFEPILSCRPGDEGESSKGTGVESAATILLTKGGTEAPVMPEPSADAGVQDQEAPASIDVAAPPCQAS
ncbi:uncharacterized protein A4U43_C01F17330 [Asparagus officinalis]|uniref:Uncharacterized protein n=1 Tax=Asparagus officinalis TaxID=4686 RepID=A0A5P1FSJ7_ASPOF|nr:uncharacterized protein A4U43_C01F17330 [Asparagus officinalis]